MKTLAVTLLILGLTGCASESKQSYAEQIASLSPPTSPEEKRQKCGYLRSEIARQQNIAAYSGTQMQGVYALAAQMQVRNNIAAVESRASDFGCLAAFGSTPAAVGTSDISSCITACKENTTRTPEQCFDSCNRQN